jgi:hypothetical protein
MVIVVDFVVPVYEPDPVPDQLAKPNPLFAVALIATLCPLFRHPLEGVTVPPVEGEADIVR